MHKSSFQSMEKFKNNYLNPEDSLNILDIGSYDASDTSYNYGRFLREDNWKYRGMDIYNWIEIEDSSFDVVISGQAFEHMEFFWKAIKEIERILKPGGLCCIIAPSAGPVHKNPYDCFRFTDNGMKQVANYVGLQTLECYVNDDEIAYPWYDCVLIARKQYGVNSNLEKRMDSLENKLDLILKKINE